MSDIDKSTIKSLLTTTGAEEILRTELIQSLWSNYGFIKRVFLKGGRYESVILKQIDINSNQSHPRGWNTDVSHQRKVQSYEVETTWYQKWKKHCNASFRVAECFHVAKLEKGNLIILEDLNNAGYSMRKSNLNLEEVKSCLKWLAGFHANFMGARAEGLWNIGTYWHLQTRPDEYRAMERGVLKEKAALIDEKLNGCSHQTLVHGDAKVANFCFHESKNEVAAVDFQYVGNGCGMKDVIYLFSSCLTEKECELHEEELLDYYFNELKMALPNGFNFNELAKEWSGMYSLAWADFLRFLFGWSPNHYKINTYSQKQITKALATL